MATSKIRFNLRTLTVPPGLAHKTRAEEIAELPQYLEVSSLIAPELVLVNMGEQEPGADRADFPWIKLNSNSEPLGLYVNAGGTWQSVFSTKVIRHTLSNQVIERGSFTLTLTEVKPGIKSEYASTFDFSEDFDEAPVVFFTITGGGILGEAMTPLGSIYSNADTNEYLGGAMTKVWPGFVTVSGFKPYWISPINLTGISRTLEVSWLAIGTREEVI